MRSMEDALDAVRPAWITPKLTLLSDGSDAQGKFLLGAEMTIGTQMFMTFLGS